MQPHEVIAKRVGEVGITKAELARRVDMPDELLRRSLNGTRKIPAPEFIKLCRILDLRLDDFD